MMPRLPLFLRLVVTASKIKVYFQVVLFPTQRRGFRVHILDLFRFEYGHYRSLISSTY